MKCCVAPLLIKFTHTTTYVYTYSPLSSPCPHSFTLSITRIKQTCFTCSLFLSPSLCTLLHSSSLSLIISSLCFTSIAYVIPLLIFTLIHTLTLPQSYSYVRHQTCPVHFVMFAELRLMITLIAKAAVHVDVRSLMHSVLLTLTLMHNKSIESEMHGIRLDKEKGRKRRRGKRKKRKRRSEGRRRNEKETNRREESRHLC